MSVGHRPAGAPASLPTLAFIAGIWVGIVLAILVVAVVHVATVQP